VESFNGACGYYCLSVQQTVAELQKCFMDGGVKPGSIFCNGNNTATATGKGGSSASPTASGKGATGTPNAGTTPNQGVAMGVSKMGLGVLGMVVVSAFAGMML
jgi:hypothetical protein